MLSRPTRRFKRFVKRLLFPGMKAPRARVPEHDWSIGIYVGESPFRFQAPMDISNPVLSHKDVSDIRASGVADPFMLRVKDTWYMFFEVIHWQNNKGDIGFAISENGVEWTYQQIVLAEPFHLSYPYIFEWQNEYYLLPESSQANSIRLYKAVNFPERWSLTTTLLEGRDYVDSSIFRFDDKWWLLAGCGAPPFYADTLCLYYATDLMGPWLQHPASPIIEANPHIARPAGRVLVLNDRVIRYAQDCSPKYGTQVHVFEINELTTTSYHEREVREGPVLRPTGDGWNAVGMHHIDPHILADGRWLACVDGWCWFNHTDGNPAGKV
jgi:hypothetical protein